MTTPARRPLTAAGSLLLVTLLCACGPGAQAFEPTPPPPPKEGPARDPQKTTSTSGGTGENQDAPEITRSEGEAGGVVVFWPRIIPKSTDTETRDLAARLQQEVAAIARATLPGATVDVRPEPERVCPQNGCKAMTVGVLLTRSKDSCAALALVSGSGKSEARIIPWVGEAKLGQDTVKFRDPPENQVKISDFARCSKLSESLGPKRDAIAAAIKTASGK